MHQSTRLSIIKERRFSKFVPGDLPSLLKSCSLTLDGDDSNSDDIKVDGAVMAMRLLGNFGRHGIQPVCILYKMGNNDDNDNNDNAEEANGMPMMRCVAYHTLTGSHFDGELRILVKETMKDNSGAVVVSVTLAIPGSSVAPPMHLAKATVLLFAHSIAQSIWIQIGQTLARRRESGGYQEQASGRALVKQHLRCE